MRARTCECVIPGAHMCPFVCVDSTSLRIVSFDPFIRSSAAVVIGL